MPDFLESNYFLAFAVAVVLLVLIAFSGTSYLRRKSIRERKEEGRDFGEDLLEGDDPNMAAQAALEIMGNADDGRV